MRVRSLIAALVLSSTPVYAGSSGGTVVASTATALAANGANCSAGSFPLGVDASGAAESCTVAITGSTGATDNALLRSDGVGGSTLQNSLVTVSDTGLTSINSTDTGTATLGAELLANPSFTTDLGSWTAGAGWAYEAGDSARHTAGSTATLAQNVTVASGSSYQVSFTISGRTAGTIAVALGAVSLNAGGPTTFTNNAGTGIVAAATGSVSFAITPSTDFDGKVDEISLKLITAGSSILTAQSSGVNFLESRGSAALFNQFLGVGSGRLNTTGSSNSAQGSYALYSNTTGSYNSAQGHYALYSNTTGSYNSAQGHYALYSNATGSSNSAQGYAALYSNTTGSSNSAQGYYALYSNTTGNSSSAQGYAALYSNTTGSYNSAQGHSSGRFIADGTTANSTSGTSTFLGAATKASANGVANETVIGYNAIGGGSNTLTLGNSSTQTLVHGGTEGVPGLAFFSDKDTGIYRYAEDNVAIVTAGAMRAIVSSSGLQGLGGSVYGYGIRTIASTAGSGAPNALPITLVGQLTTNEGSAAKNYNTLPTAVAGYSFTFVVQDADGLRITAAAGDTIRIAAAVSTVAGYCESITIGDSVTLVAINATEWVATALVGAGWTCA